MKRTRLPTFDEMILNSFEAVRNRKKQQEEESRLRKETYNSNEASYRCSSLQCFLCLIPLMKEAVFMALLIGYLLSIQLFFRPKVNDACFLPEKNVL